MIQIFHDYALDCMSLSEIMVKGKNLPRLVLLGLFGENVQDFCENLPFSLRYQGILSCQSALFPFLFPAHSTCSA